MPTITDLATTSAVNKKTDITNLATKAALDTKATEMKIKQLVPQVLLLLMSSIEKEQRKKLQTFDLCYFIGKNYLRMIDWEIIQYFNRFLRFSQ